MRFNALIIFILYSYTGFSQSTVPLPVLSAFDAMHPLAENTFWEYREGAVVATFPAPRGLTKAFFNEEGKWLETRIRISPQTLPKAVSEYIYRFYPEAELSYVGKVLSPWGKVAYRVESELQNEVVIKLIDIHGELLEEQRITFQVLEASQPRLLPLPDTKVEPMSRDELDQ